MCSAPDSLAAPVEARERIRDAVDAALLEGFHAMAQPLTILQSRIESELLAAARSEAGTAFLVALAGEVERLCLLLRPLQQLLAARTANEPSRCAIDLWELLSPILGDFALFFANAAITFEIVPPARALPLVLAAPDTLREIAGAMLSSAAAVAAAEDWVQCRFEAFQDAVILSVSNRSSCARPVPVLTEIHLALAGVRAFGQGAELVFSQAPFALRLLLPAAPVPQGS